MPDINRTKEHNTPQPLRKISLRTKDGRRRQTQDLIFQHPHDYMNIRYMIYNTFDMELIPLLVYLIKR
jgi:hypothetical protein